MATTIAGADYRSYYAPVNNPSIDVTFSLVQSAGLQMDISQSSKMDLDNSGAFFLIFKFNVQFQCCNFNGLK